jgi:PPE-repeat protein
MTAPIWMAAPPEVHSALLSSGPGPGSLLAAAGAWNSLSAEYASVADELSAVLADVQAGAWQGPSAESYIAAHAPYLAWLMQASANSAAAATQHETAAAAHTAALAAMPTLPELATNHVVHGVLLATNFFGINMIPIAVNEADYVRMWIQAATTMGIYDVVSSTAVAATPQTTPAPQIQKSDASSQGSGNPFPDPTVDNPLDDFIASILKNFGINWNPAQGLVNGLPYDSYANPGQPIYWVVRALELFEDFQQFGVYLMQNPALAFQYLVALEMFDWPTHIAQIAGFLAQPELLVPAVMIALAPVGALGGFAGLAGLAALPQPAVVPAPVPAAVAPSLVPVLGPTPIAAPAAAPVAAPATAPAPTASTVASPAPPPPAPPAAGGAGFLPPYVVGPPGIGVGSGMSTSASSRSSAKRKTPESDDAAAATGAAAREQARARRRRRAKQREYGDEFADMDIDVDPDWDAGVPPTRGGEPVASMVASMVASERGAGTLGFAGTVSKDNAQAAGLATLSGDDFGGGPRMPMLPNSWDAEAREGEQQDS